MELGTLVGYLQLNGDDFDKGLGKAESGLAAFAKRSVVKAAAAGAAIAAAVVGSVVGGMDIEAGTDKVAAQLNLSGPDAERAGKLAGELYAGAYVGSLEEGGQLVRSIAQNIGTDLNDVDFSQIAAKVADLSNGFDTDLGATTKAVGQLMKTGLAANADEALDIVTAGFQGGADASGDFLDTLNEYGVQFQKLGIDGATATGLISQGMQAGARDSDIVADAFKEFSLRAIEGAEAAAPYFEQLGLNAADMTAAISGGGAGATAALDQVLDGLRGFEDPAQRAQIAAGLFGTQAEDLGAALYALDPSEAAAGLGELEGRAASFGTTLNDNAVTSLQSFKNQAQLAFFGLANNAIPVISSVVSSLATKFGPAVSGAGAILKDDLLPAARSVFGFLSDHQTTVTVIAGLVGGVLVAAFAVWAARSVAAAATNTVAWFTTATASSTSAATQSRSAMQVVVGWTLMATQALAQGTRIAAVWTAQIVRSAVVGAASFAVSAASVVASWVVMGARAVAQGAVVAAQWAMAAARTVASLAVMAAGFAAQGAVMAASAAVTAARVVAGWVLMGAQSTIQAARMAAAWFIALGPIGWVTAAVIGLVALVIANWSRVKDWTVSAWNAVVGAVTGAWRSVTGAVSSGVSTVVTWVQGLPGRILGALGNMGSLLYSAGSDLLLGMVNGIKNVAGRVASAVKDAASAAVNGVKSFLGINSPSRVFAEIGTNVGQGMVNGIAGMRPAVAAEMQRMADFSALESLNVPAYASPAASSAQPVATPAGATTADGLGGGGVGTLLNVENVNLVEGTPRDLANELAIKLRTGSL
jgi:phage-related minor tail protein